METRSLRHVPAWVERSIHDQLTAVRRAPEGGRAQTVNAAAYRIGRLVRAARWSEARAVQALAEAVRGQTRPLPGREAQRAIERGLRDGQRDPVEVRETRGGSMAVRRLTFESAARPHIEPRPDRQHPPHEDIDEMLSSRRSVPVTEDEQVSAYLRSRGIDPERIAEAGIARALVTDELPRWAWSPEGPWTDSHHRILVPLYDHQGVMRSVIARRAEQRANDPLKSTSPAKCSRTGLVMACPYALRMLGGRARPHRVAVVEGEVDLLAAVAAISDADEDAPAVLGMFGGGWSAEVAARIPDGATVIVATDHDAAGERYATEIARSIVPPGRVRLVRWEVARG